MAKSLAAWNPLGKQIDLDNQSYDCVDVPKSWAEYLTDKPWQQSFAWGNAKDIWYNIPGTYWDKIAKGGEVRPGDVVCMSGAIGGGYGHIAVVIEVIGNNIKVLQQNTFTQQAVYTGVYDKNASYIQGYLRPKVPFTVGIEATLQKFQRVLGTDVTFYRQGASRSAALMSTDSVPGGKLVPGETYDFKGFVRGESVDGNNIWFVGMYSGGYAWSGGFTDTGTHDLPQIATDVVTPPTPTPTPTPTPEPTPTPTPQPSTFTPDSSLVTEVVASPNFIEQTADPQYIVVHQWDDPAKKPSYAGVIAHFLKTDPGIAPHYVVDDNHITQTVQESKRAQHAGPKGNDHYGIEFDPNGGEKMYARGRALIADMRKRTGKELPLKGHSEFMATTCPKYIDMARLEPTTEQPTPTDLEARVAKLEDFRDKVIQFFKNQ